MEERPFWTAPDISSGAGDVGSGKIKRGKLEVVLKGRDVKATIVGEVHGQGDRQGNDWSPSGSATDTTEACTLTLHVEGVPLRLAGARRR